MAKDTIQWVDASKRSPRKGQHVMVLTKRQKKYNYQYNLCQYRNGKYWAEIHSKSYYGAGSDPANLANKMDFHYVCEDVVAWTDAKKICRLADTILKNVKWED
jgi:hypothetical protein